MTGSTLQDQCTHPCTVLAASSTGLANDSCHAKQLSNLVLYYTLSTLAVTCVAEVPVFQAQGWLMGRLSVSALLDVTLATYAARMLAYAALPGWGSPWAVLPVEVLHGVTFGLGWGVGCSHCRRLAPPGMGATLQAVFQGCYFGLGYGLGSLVGGWVSQRAGFPVMFVTAAGVMGAGWVGLFVARRWVARKAGVTVGRS